MLEGQTHEVLQLTDDNGNGDTGGKTGGNGIGNVFNHTAHVQQAHENQHDTGHNGGHGKAVHTVFRNDTRHNGGEGGGGAGNLHLTSAEEGDDKARHNGRVEALLRTHAGGQCQRDG